MATTKNVPKTDVQVPDLDDDHQYLMDRDNSVGSIPIAYGKGNYLFTAGPDSRKILDASGGASVSSFGHGDLRVVQATSDQMVKAAYVGSMLFSTPCVNDLVREVAKPAGFAKMYTCCSGSEAMEGTIKLAHQYFYEIGQPERVKFISRHQSYHGTTIGALSMSGHKARRELFEDYLSDNFQKVSPCYAYRQRDASTTDEQFVIQKAAELEKKILELGPETVVGFVCETIGGASLGCVPYVPGYLAAMKAVCVNFGILFILDEVMCGMGRTGTMHSWQAEHSEEPGHDCRPDIQIVGKSIAAGYQAVAGILIGHRVAAAVTRFASGHTFQAFAPACAAALEVQRIIKEENLLENVCKQGAYLSDLLHKRLDSHPYVGDIRGKGLFWGIEFVKDKATKEPFDPKFHIARKLRDVALGNKWNMQIYMGEGTADGESGDHVILSPAFNITSDVVELIVERMVGVIEDVFAELAPRIAEHESVSAQIAGMCLSIETDSDSSGPTTTVNTPSSSEEWSLE